MADGFVQVPPDSTGKLIDTNEIQTTVGTVERQRVAIPDTLTISGDTLTQILIEQRVQNLLLSQGLNVLDGIDSLRNDVSNIVALTAAPSTPGGSSGQLQYDNSGVFGGITNVTTDGTNLTGARIKSTASLDWDNGSGTVDLSILRDAANTLAQRNSTNAQTYRLYNTYTDASNYERATFDWSTTSNALTIGTQAAGTGTARDLNFTSASSHTAITGNSIGGTSSGTGFAIALGWNVSANKQLWLGDPDVYGDSGNYFIRLLTVSKKTYIGCITGDGATAKPLQLGEPSSSVIVGFDNTATAPAAYLWVNGTASVGTGNKAVAPPTDGLAIQTYLNWGGEARVTSDVTFTSNTTLGTITGLSVNVAAGRTYAFVAEISWTDAAAGGLQLAISGTATATNIIYDGYIIDSAANGIKGNAQATSLGTAVASSTTTGTAGHARIAGTITVNAAGTLLVQGAQNTSNGTATTFKRGSSFIVHDIP